MIQCEKKLILYYCVWWFVIMGKIHTYEVYHATDTSNVSNILSNGFVYKANDRHWLGNGFYFFFDRELANRWAIQDIKGYGKITSPSCIRCIVEVDEDRVLDLRFLENYNFVKKYFQTFIESFVGRLDIKNAGREKLRCLFFNYLKKKNDIYCVIACFNERNNLAEETGYENERIFKEMKIPYVETQICVSRNECIVYKEVI